MPILLNNTNDPEINAIVTEIVQENIPELNANTWEKELDKNGINLQTLASMFAESLREARPAVRLKAIQEHLHSMGATRKKIENDLTPTFIINGENIQINSVLTPKR